MGFTILLLLHSQLYLWDSPFFFFCILIYISGVRHSSSSSVLPAISLGFTFFFCVPSCISGVHHSKSSSAFKAVSLGFTFFFVFFCIPSYISGVHCSSSSALSAISLGFTIFGEIFAYVTIFLSNHRGSHIQSSWMVHVGCVCVAGIHPTRTWISESF